ncbi:MAG: hypothetical protein AMXMBFR33_05510 [Candidatus Xenobia bacterium]
MMHRVVLTCEGGLRARHFLRCFDETGRELWSFRLAQPRAMTQAGGRVFVAEGNRVVALDEETGRPLWKTMAGPFGAETLLADREAVYAFALGDHSTMAVGPRGTSGHLTALSALTGGRLWQHRFVPGLREISLAEDRLFAVQYQGASHGYRRLEIDRRTGRGVSQWFELSNGTMVAVATPERAIAQSSSASTTRLRPLRLAR